MKIKLEIDGEKIELPEELIQTIEEAVEKKPVETLKPGMNKIHFIIHQNLVHEQRNIIKIHGDSTEYYGNGMGAVDDFFNVGDTFTTEKAAEKELKKRKAIMRVREYIANEFGVFGPDWGTPFEDRHVVIYDIIEKSFECGEIMIIYIPSPIGHLRTQEDAQKVIDNCEDDLKIIWDV